MASLVSLALSKTTALVAASPFAFASSDIVLKGINSEVDRCLDAVDAQCVSEELCCDRMSQRCSVAVVLRSSKTAPSNSKRLSNVSTIDGSSVSCWTPRESSRSGNGSWSTRSAETGSRETRPLTTWGNSDEVGQRSFSVNSAEEVPVRTVSQSLRSNS
jgi:hypothetical protein